MPGPRRRAAGRRLRDRTPQTRCRDPLVECNAHRAVLVTGQEIDVEPVVPFVAVRTATGRPATE